MHFDPRARFLSQNTPAAETLFQPMMVATSITKVMNSSSTLFRNMLRHFLAESQMGRSEQLSL